MMPLWTGCPGTNYHAGRHGFRPEAIVVHIMDGTFEAGEAVCLDPAAQKSADCRDTRVTKVLVNPPVKKVSTGRAGFHDLTPLGLLAH